MAHARVDRGMHTAVPPVWRRFTGVEAEEIYIQCRPDPRHSGDIARQTASIYDACGSLLQGERGSLEHVVHQVVFFRNIRRDRRAISKKRFGKSTGRPPEPMLHCRRRLLSSSLHWTPTPTWP